MAGFRETLNFSAMHHYLGLIAAFSVCARLPGFLAGLCYAMAPPLQELSILGLMHKQCEVKGKVSVVLLGLWIRVYVIKP